MNDMNKLAITMMLIATIVLFSTGHWIGGIVQGFFLGVALERW